ncbi:sensor histidine kinase [Caenimonas terrae]|uniref:histidine kinase n=1 Tax=Caenimonas terrae TaxID=696074 RepID=A0ABW0NH08_9BURK
MRLPRWLVPDTLFGRVVLIVVAGLSAGYFLSATLALRELHRNVLQLSAGDVARQVDAAFRVARLRRSMAAGAGAGVDLSTPEIAVSAGPGQLAAAAPSSGQVEADVAGALDAAIRARVPQVEALAIRVTRATVLKPWDPRPPASGGAFFGPVELEFVVDAIAGGESLHFASRPSPPPRTQAPSMPVAAAIGNMAIRFLAVLACALVAAKVVTMPFARISAAIARLGDDIARNELEVTGPVEARRLASSFNEMRARLVRFVEQRTALMAAISHDLRTPLTRARLRVELLEEGEHKRKLEEHLDDMQQLLNLTLDYALAQARTREPVPVEITAVLNQAREALGERGVHVRIEGPPVSIVGDPLALKRCFCNLFDNAVKYAGRADVAVAAAAGGVDVVISDRGPGIPPELFEAVLEPFARVEPSRHRDHGGVGLGLTIARDVIYAHQGRLTMANGESGQGLVVRVWLPGS